MTLFLHASQRQDLQTLPLREMAHLAAVLVRSKLVLAPLALCTHFVLHSGEIDYYTRSFLSVWGLAFSGIATIQYLYEPHAPTLSAAIAIAANAALVYFGTLVTSVLIYRGFFHRLHKVQKTPDPSIMTTYN